MTEETFTSSFPRAARGSACENSPFVRAEPWGARYLTHASHHSDEKQAIKGGGFNLLPAIFTFPVLFFCGWGEGIWFKLEIPGFALLQQLKFLE